MDYLDVTLRTALGVCGMACGVGVISVLKSIN